MPGVSDVIGGSGFVADFGEMTEHNLAVDC
jgi:hypothetical protein